jgi:UDP-N-acetylglucosamine diphosphorylase/glucosamine-1-phosphate N-acetyltransferase
MKVALIMAGGLGKRMESSIPKVLHQIQSKPMICWVIEKAFASNCEQIGIIVGKYKEQISQVVTQWFPDNKQIVWIDQEEPLGTGHAVKCALNWMGTNLQPDTDVLILSGDVPLISIETLENLSSKPNSLLVTMLSNPYGYGRVWIDTQTNYPKQIIEEKDCNLEQKNIKFVNCGIYLMKLSVLQETIPQISSSNASNEYYLTDIIKLAYDSGYKLNYYELPQYRSIEIANINTKQDLEQLNLRISN